jgi:hypothetical protein
MCRIMVTHVEGPHPGIRQILCRRAVFAEGEETMDPPEWRYDFRSIPEETREYLMRFLRSRQWSLACDILEEHPPLVAPWASNFLRDVVLEGHFSAEDFDIFCAHIFVLDLAQTLGIERTRAFLSHLG